MAGAGKAHRGNSPMARKQSQVDSTANVEVYGLFVIVALLIVKEWPMLIPTITPSLTSTDIPYCTLGIWKKNAQDSEV